MTKMLENTESLPGEQSGQPAPNIECFPYVAVLINGNSYWFLDGLVRAGAVGGQNAAHILNLTVKSKLGSLGLDGCDIVVKIFANLAGLSKSMSELGLCEPEERSLAPFFAAFSRSHCFFDLVDVGDIDEKDTDIKIATAFRMFVHSAQCSHVFFAACHNPSHALNMGDFTRGRDFVTLVNIFSVHVDYYPLGFRFEEFSEVFRSGPGKPDGLPQWVSEIVDNTVIKRVTNTGIHASNNTAISRVAKRAAKRKSNAAVTAAIKAALNTVTNHATSTGADTGTHAAVEPAIHAAPHIMACTSFPISAYPDPNQCYFPHIQDDFHAHPFWQSQLPINTGIQDPFGADARNTKGEGSSSGDSKAETIIPALLQIAYPFNGSADHTSFFHQFTINFADSLPMLYSIPPHHVAINKDGHRLDPYLSPTSPANQKEFEDREIQKKLCTNFYLLNHCTSGPLCPYDHNLISPGVLKCLQRSTYDTLCFRGGDCRSLSCTSAHICQNAHCSYRGGHVFCSFGTITHAVDLNLTEYVMGHDDIVKSAWSPETASIEGSVADTSMVADNSMQSTWGSGHGGHTLTNWGFDGGNQMNDYESNGGVSL